MWAVGTGVAHSSIPQKKYEVNHAANIVLCMECIGTLNYTGEYNYHTAKVERKKS